MDAQVNKESSVEENQSLLTINSLQKEEPLPETSTSFENKGDGAQEDDCYHYTKRGEFTSELFKICVDNLPHYVGYTQMKKTFAKLNVIPRKLKFDRNSCLAFLTFRSEEEREAAIKAINGYKFKKHVLEAKKAKPKPDPQLRKRQMEASGEIEAKKLKQEEQGCPFMPKGDLPPETRLKYVVANLCDMPYPDQLQLKYDSMVDVLKTLTKDLSTAHGVASWVSESSEQFDGLCCKLEEIIKSPILDKYRNKVEFNIGPNTSGKTTVGFRLGTYKDDNFAVVEPTECINVSDEAKKIARVFQSYIQSSDREPYDPGIHTGYWRQLTVRSCRSGEIMVVVQVHPQQMNRTEIESLKQSLKKVFSNIDLDFKISSLYLQLRGQGRTGQSNNETYEHILGSEIIHEEMLKMKFQISPDAFFQVNTPAAEKLYSKIGDWCHITKGTTVLDVCCGTGTIGLFLAKRAKKVIGIELCQQAIDDAKKNAALNGIENAEFICGKAEDVLPSIVRRLDSQKVVAVVDPPRAGLHKKVIIALRQCLKIKRLIFVSCDAKKASTNFLDLCRPTTNRNKGDPYKLVQAVPVDLFPHTYHCELILSMERNDEDDSIAPAASTGSTTIDEAINIPTAKVDCEAKITGDINES